MATYNVNKISKDGNEYNLKDFRSTGVYYGTCATAAATQQKEVTIVDARGNQFFELATGVIIFVKFTNNQNYSGAQTMRINSTASTLKSIKRYGTTNGARYEWYAGEVVGFIYDGTNYVIIDGGTASTSYFGVTQLNNSATSTSQTVAATPRALLYHIQNMIANFPVWVKSTSYAVGDKVLYSYSIYECITANTDSAWTAAHWQVISPLYDLIAAIRQLPAVTSSDNGKTLQVANGAWTVTTPSGGLPSVTSSDNGKVLRVVDGAWAAATIPDANGQSF